MSDYPRRPKSNRWKTAKDLHHEFFGGESEHVRNMLDLRQCLIADIKAAGYSAEFADAVVEQALVGQRRSRSSDTARRASATAASPEAIRLLNLTVRSTRPDGWQTISALAKTCPISEAALTARFRRLRSRLVEDLVAAGVSDELAAEMLETHLFGRFEDPDSGQAAMALSPLAVRILEAEGGLARRGRG